MNIDITLKEESKRDTLPQDEKNLGFGRIFTDHMFIHEYKEDQWGKPTIEPFRNFSLSPAALVLHYGQEIFEGMKAFRQEDGKGVSLFRPEMNAQRMIDSAKRMDMPSCVTIIISCSPSVSLTSIRLSSSSSV